MHDKVRRPAHDEAADDSERHLHRSDFGARYRLCVALRLAERDSAVAVCDVLALAPDDAHDVDVAVRYDGSRDYEDVRREEREVELTLPPVRVALAHATPLDVSVRVDPAVHLLEDEELRCCEHKRHQPRHRDHLPGARTRRRSEAQRAADRHVAVGAHGDEDEGGAGEGDDLHVQEDLAGGGAEYPGAVEDDEQYLRRHREAAHGEVADGQIDDEDVDAPIEAPVLAARQHEDDDDVAEQRQRHDDGESDDALDNFRCPHLAAPHERKVGVGRSRAARLHGAAREGHGRIPTQTGHRCDHRRPLHRQVLTTVHVHDGKSRLNLKSVRPFVLRTENSIAISVNHAPYSWFAFTANDLRSTTYVGFVTYIVHC